MRADMRPLEPVKRLPSLVSDIRKFFTPAALDGPLLLGAMILAMICINSPLAWLYDKLLSARFEIRLEGLELSKPILLWINDGLMALFFLLIAIEIKHEALEGHLRHRSQIVLPGVAAAAGICVPALIYWLLNKDDPVAVQGWAIPSATDIAFSLGVLGLFGTRVPRSLRAFLMTLAVFDDIAAIVIIAFFYAGKISWLAHLLALAATFALILMNRWRITRLGPYFVVGTILWVCVLKSGVHATLAGVVLGLTIPYRGRSPGDPSPMKAVEHMLHPWVAFLILPAFAFGNSGVRMEGVGWDILAQPVTLGITLGLFAGKAIGVFGCSWLLIRFGLAPMPHRANWGSLLGVSLLAGIGFTMSMFIGTLAFEGSNILYATGMRLGVICGSLVSAVVGAAVLLKWLPRGQKRAAFGQEAPGSTSGQGGPSGEADEYNGP